MTESDTVTGNRVRIMVTWWGEWREKSLTRKGPFGCWKYKCKNLSSHNLRFVYFNIYILNTYYTYVYVYMLSID